MSKVVVNKNFNDKYLKHAYIRLFQLDYDRGASSTMYRHMQNGAYPYNWYWGTDSVSFSTCYRSLESELNGNWYGTTAVDPTAGYVGLSQSYLICSESFLKLINVINKKWKKSADIPLVSDNPYGGQDSTKVPVYMKFLANTLFHTNKYYRDTAINYFQRLGYITKEEAEYAKSNTTVLRRLTASDNGTSLTTNSNNTNNLVRNTDITVTNEDSIISISIDKILQLNSPYKRSETNLNGENMYVLVVPYSDTKFIDGYTWITSGTTNIFGYSYSSLYADPGTFTTFDNANYQIYVEHSDTRFAVPYQAFHKKDTNTVVEQIPYIALSISEVGEGGDIQLDHTDVIEYLDEIKIKVALPRVYA